MINTQRTVLLAGATGLVGGFALKTLLSDSSVAKIHVLSQRALHVVHPKIQTHIVDFTRLPALPEVDEVYLALGTTIKVAGSQAAFRAVDFDANFSVASSAVLSGARRVAPVSAAAANSRSTMFYNRVKGELEDALKSLDLDALVIAQPSLFLNYRNELQQPVRIGERIAIPMARLLAPILPGAYQPVQAQAVARALIRTLPEASGTIVMPSHKLAQVGRE